MPNFPNFFILMGPNTVTGHLSVIYTVECQINFILSLITPIIKTLPSYKSTHSSLLPFPSLSSLASFSSILPSKETSAVKVTASAAEKDSSWIQREAKKLVWSSGCTSWAVDAQTGMNVMLYPDWQFAFWLRSVFWNKGDFRYTTKNAKGERKEAGPSSAALQWTGRVALLGMFVGAGLIGSGVVEKGELQGLLRNVVHSSQQMVQW